MKYKFSDICLKIGSGATPKGGKNAYCRSGISLIRSQNVFDFEFSVDGLAYINQQQADKLKNVIVREGDVLLNITGDSVARACMVDINFLPARVNQHVCIIRANKEKVLGEFLLYWLQKNKLHLLQMASGGATRNALTKDMISNLEIDLPSLVVQQRIVSLINDIQVKINVNNNINNNLVQQVQTVFGEWLATHIDVSTEVSLGEICVKVTDGSHFSPKDEPLSTIPMLSVKDMGEFDFNLSSCKHISESDYHKMVASDCVPQVDDILVAKDGSYLKEIFICNKQRQLAILSSIAIFRPDTSKIYPEILLAFLKSPRVLQEVSDNYVSGSALPRIVLKDFKKLLFMLPNMTAQSDIAPLLLSIRKQITINEEENQRLALLRDTLLPKLMSGEINVSEIEL